MSDTHSWKSNLVDRFPHILGASELRTQGIQCGQGWSDLLEDLCNSLDTLDEPGRPKVRAVVVKERLGSLRFLVVHASARQHGAIDVAIKLSRKICEKCGSPAVRADSRHASGAPPRCCDHLDCALDGLGRSSGLQE